MGTVTGYFNVVKDGVITSTTFAGLEYNKFWLGQKGVIDVLNQLSMVGLLPLLGMPAKFEGIDTAGDVRYDYLVDFSEGGSSSGSMSWNGIGTPAAEWIAAKLGEAASVFKQ
jgi:hypothetical protein